MMSKLEGGIGSLAHRVQATFEAHGGELRHRVDVKRIVLEGGRVAGVEVGGGEVITAPIVASNLDPGVTLTRLIDPSQVAPDLVRRLNGVDHRAAYVQMHFALDGLPEYAPPYDFLNEPGMQASVGAFGSPEHMQLDWEECRRGVIPPDPAMGLQIPSVYDPGLAPPGKHAASAFAFSFPVEVPRSRHGELKDQMADRMIQKITRLAPNFKDIVIRHTTFASFHMETMFGCPGGDFCHGLLHPDLMGPHRPGPHGYLDLPIGIEGLYLCGAGCQRRPGHHLHPRLQRRPARPSPMPRSCSAAPAARPPPPDEPGPAPLPSGRTAANRRRRRRHALDDGVRSPPNPEPGHRSQPPQSARRGE